MTDNVDKIIKLVKGRGFTTESQVRNYLKTRIPNEGTIDDVIRILVSSKVVSAELTTTEQKSEPTFPAYRKALAQFFQINKGDMTKSRMRMEMSFKMHWFTPSDADMFISFCIRDGLLQEKDGKITPTFDTESISIPPDWSIHEELNIKTGHEIASERIKRGDLDRQIQYAQNEKAGDVKQMMAEDGIDVDDAEVFDVRVIADDMTASGRNGFKITVVKKLLLLGMSAKCSNGLFDYFELNYGIIDANEFVSVSAKFEGVSDDKMLRRAYDVLSKEVWC